MNLQQKCDEYLKTVRVTPMGVLPIGEHDLRLAWLDGYASALLIVQEDMKKQWAKLKP